MVTPFVLQLVVALLFAQEPATPRSLADVARMEAARRQELSTSGKRFTNADLRRYASEARPGSTAYRPEAIPAPGASPQTAAPHGAAAAAPQPAVEKEEEVVKDEEWWRARITAARTRLERSRVLLDALQSRINALTNDFYARDDPYQRAAIEQERNRALAELERMRQEVEENAKAITDIEEEARQAGVPPGWLR